MEKGILPIRIICPGRVYRNETISARAHCFFHQVEGLYIDENVSFADLKQTLYFFVQAMFGTDVKLEEADEAARRVRLSADGRELRGRGAARATVESSLFPANGGTKVDIVTDLSLTGPAAQYGRGLVADVSSQLIDRFADCLKAQLDSAGPERAEEAVAEAAKPVGGLRLGLAALWRSFTRLFRRRR